jgi:hypothetical protein
MEDILYLFHHIHHGKDDHAIHHCGEEHKKIDSTVNYTITHCSCGKHNIDCETAVGHTINENIEIIGVIFVLPRNAPMAAGTWKAE